MKTVGIICEYNPFHLGHLRQLNVIRQTYGADTRIVCAMSGHYVQRGVPAMWEKYTRAGAAVACGADLVVELPVTGVLQSAEGFAGAGVEVLTRLGCEILSFGSECGDGSLLMELAQKLDSPECKERLKAGLERGLSYAAARQLALQDEQNILCKPNNILGLEYCRAILSLDSPMVPMTITRTGDYHAETLEQEAPSATAIRAVYPHGNWKTAVPEPAVPILEDAPWYDLAFGERAVLARLRSLTAGEWERCAHGSEGLWSKAMKAARSQPTLEAILEATKSKRYPRTRIQRLLLCAYLGITAEDLRAPISHIRILAASAPGRAILRRAKDEKGIPILNPGQTPTDLEIRCADLHTLFAAPEFSMDCKTEQEARLQVL